jgi:hypothetical protein
MFSYERDWGDSEGNDVFVNSKLDSCPDVGIMTAFSVIFRSLSM